MSVRVVVVIVVFHPVGCEIVGTVKVWSDVGREEVGWVVEGEELDEGPPVPSLSARKRTSEQSS